MPDTTPPQLAHHVFFTLRNKSPDKVRGLVEACHKYLNQQPGIVYFAAGTREPELARPVNDAEFDVALTVVFATREDHDRYQDDEQHHQFIAEQKDNWEQVRVFDANV